MKIDIDTSELSAFARQLINDAPKQAEQAVRQATIAEGRAMKSRAIAGAPRDTGWLAATGVRMKTWKNRDGVAVNVFTIPNSEGRNEGFYQEYGTSRHAPQPFLLPAVIPAESSYPAAVLAAVNPLEKPGGDGGGGDE